MCVSCPLPHLCFYHPSHHAQVETYVRHFPTLLQRRPDLQAQSAVGAVEFCTCEYACKSAVRPNTFDLGPVPR